MTADETYLAAISASAAILADAYRAADQFHADVIDGAHETLKAISINLAALVERDRAYGDASDARAFLYAEAEQRHQDRLAALAHHFGQFYRGPGNPAADHALDFVATLDPAGEHKVAAPEPTPIRRIEFGGNDGAAIGPSSGAGRITREAGAILSPSGAPSLIPFDRSIYRETFTGSPAEFAAAKARGVMTPTELAGAAAAAATLGFPEHPDGNAVAAVEPPAPAAEAIPRPPSPPAGLLADIAATLARTAR